MGCLILNIIYISIMYLLNNFIFLYPFNKTFFFIFAFIGLIINIVFNCFCVSYYNKLNSIKPIIIIKNTNKDTKEKTKVYLSPLYLLLALILLIGFTFLTSSKTFNYQKYRELSGKISEVEFSKDMNVVDLENLPIIDNNIARNLADKKIGEIPSLGSKVKIGEFTLQKVDGHLFYVAPLEHSGFFQWISNKTTPGYIKVDATEENKVELVTELKGKPINLTYLNSSFFSKDINRYAFNLNKFENLTDFTFELDNEGNPYWTISIYKKTIGLKGEKTTGVLIIDAQTGEYKRYDIKDVPEWVDLIESIDFVKNNLNNWGTLIHGVFNFSHKDELQLTSGIKTIYDGKDCYYYSGLTSVGTDESLVGFSLTNTRTNETHIYKMPGAVEQAAMSSAKGIAEYQAANYSAIEPLLINVQDVPTYFMPLVDNKGLVKAYTFVNVKSYNIVGHGNTIQQAYNSYIEGLSKDTYSFSRNTETTTKQGTIDRIGMYINNGNTYYMINLVNDKTKYIVSTEISKDVCLAEKGDDISISYINNTTTSNQITIKSFENISTK